MEIRENILLRYLEEAAIEQIASDYQKNGYEVLKEQKLDNMRADLVAKKGNELVVFEFKSGKWNEDKIESVKRLRDYVVNEFGGAEFKLVLVNLPKRDFVEIENLDQILLDLVINKPELYDNLATHVKINDVSDIELERVEIHKDEIEILGSGVVSMIIQYGSKGDVENGDGLRSSSSFLLNFHIIFDGNFEVKEIVKLELDTSDY